MHANIFRGVGVALVTPFTASRSIDYLALEKLINHVIDGAQADLETLCRPAPIAATGL